jgi:N-acetylmuramoyl-L-alanine amidase
VPNAPKTAPQEPAASAALSTIRAVYREALPEVVRVTIEMDREVPFYQERLEGPARLFFDLKGTRTISSLVDAVFRYETDVIRHIRLGRHPGNTTRIVLDLEHVSRYSVFTLYNPYRIVIDSERAGSAPVPTLQAALAPLKLAAQLETPGTRAALPSRMPSPPVAAAPKSNTAPAAATQPESAAPASSTSPATAVPSTVAAAPMPTTPSTNSSGKYSVARQLGLGVSRIVIDAGHGGHDPGASVSGLSEADLVLDVALRLEKLLLNQPGMEVLLTRRHDEFLTLEERTEIANRESADLFLSIHANASADETAQGVETYFLNFALNPKAEAVAARENAASGRTMNSLPSIIKAITLNSKLNESRDFAGAIQRSLVRGLRPGNKNLRDLGVKQAPFMVLIGAAMPSVLAEIAFVTNRQEARLLKTPAYRQRIAESLMAGILRYQQSLKKVQTAALH